MFKRVAVSALFAGVLLASGCASVPMAPQAEDVALKTFAPPPAGKAGLYIYRNSAMGQALKKNVYVDGEFLGETANKVYFYRVLEPGKHVVSTESEFSDNALNFEAEADQNYYTRQYIKLGVFVGGAGIEMVSEEEGQKNVLQSRLAK